MAERILKDNESRYLEMGKKVVLNLDDIPEEMRRGRDLNWHPVVNRQNVFTGMRHTADVPRKDDKGNVIKDENGEVIYDTTSMSSIELAGMCNTTEALELKGFSYAFPIWNSGTLDKEGKLIARNVITLPLVEDVEGNEYLLVVPEPRPGVENPNEETDEKGFFKRGVVIKHSIPRGWGSIREELRQELGLSNDQIVEFLNNITYKGYTCGDTALAKTLDEVTIQKGKMTVEQVEMLLPDPEDRSVRFGKPRLVPLHELNTDLDGIVNAAFAVLWKQEQRISPVRLTDQMLGILKFARANPEVLEVINKYPNMALRALQMVGDFIDLELSGVEGIGQSSVETGQKPEQLIN